MREIRFRAWDTHRKKMWSAEEMGRDQLTLSVNGGGLVNVNSADVRFSDFMKHLIPMQFTGLQDKEGQEIYEGDILESEDIMNGKNIRMSVEYKTDHLELWENECGHTQYAGFSFSDGYPEEMIVVGNVHENPELLEKEK